MRAKTIESLGKARRRATIIGLLEDMGQVPLAGAHQSISVRWGRNSGVDRLCPGDPAVTIDRIYFDRSGRFVELAISTFNMGRYSYRLELRLSVR